MTKDVDQLIATLAEDRLPIKSAGHPVKLSFKWLAATAVYLIVILALTGLRPDVVDKLAEPWWIAELIVLLGVIVSTSISAALLAWPDVYQKRSLAFLPAWMFAFFVLAVYFAWRAESPPAIQSEHAFDCTLSIALVTLMPAAWTLYGIRRFASTHYRLAGGLALLSAFSIGAFWLRLYEDNDSMTHVIAWHYLPMLAAGLLGVWLGGRVLKW